GFIRRDQVPLSLNRRSRGVLETRRARVAVFISAEREGLAERTRLPRTALVRAVTAARLKPSRYGVVEIPAPSFGLPVAYAGARFRRTNATSDIAPCIVAETISPTFFSSRRVATLSECMWTMKR